MRTARIVVLVILCPWLASRGADAQIKKVGPGSTVQGDILRGEGVFLEGAGWYDLNEAKAAARNADTMKKIYDWNEQIARAYRLEYNAAVESEMRRRKLNDEARRQFLADREFRLRTKPNSEDIEKGDALNALLTDLSDPTIRESSWRGAKVPLPDDISIKGLAFRFTPKSNAKENASLTRGLIALGRLDTAGHWPDVFPLDKLKAEIANYEAAYDNIRVLSIEGRLEYEHLAKMDESLKALRGKVGVVVNTERGFRAEALKFVDQLIAATKMFDASTLGFAREMISDTNKYEAHTVGELLAFMRKYRLVFAQADASPGGEAMYTRLYGLMRDQKEALGIKDEPTRKPDSEIDSKPEIFLSEIPFLSKKHAGDLFSANGTMLGKTITVKGKPSPHGIFCHPIKNSYSEVAYKINGEWSKFTGSVAVPSIGDAAEQRGIGSELTFQVIGDDKVLWSSQPLQKFDSPQFCEVQVKGINVLKLRVLCPGPAWCARTMWLEPRLTNK